MPLPQRPVLTLHEADAIPTDFASVRAGFWYYLMERWQENRGQVRPGTHVFAGNATEVARVVGWMTLRVGVDYHRFGGNDPVTQAVFDAAQFFVNAGVLRVDFDDPRFYVLTKYGTDLVSMDTPSFAWDASGAAAQFAREFRAVPGSDVMARYVGQAVQAVHHQMNLAGAVMIGCAYELALYQLADALMTKGADRLVAHAARKVLEAHGKRGERGQRPPNAADLVDAVKEALLAKRADLAGMEDWVESSYGSAFYYVRVLRNAAGHPSGKDVPLDDVARHVAFFNLDYRSIRTVVGAVDAW